MIRLFLFFYALAASVNAAPPSVILVALDTVRADHTSLYGYARETTPALAALGEKGTVFEAFHSQSDWTLPAFTSLLTGLRPATHGVFKAFDRLADSRPTMASIFQAHGFATAAFTAGVLDSENFGLGRGFDELRGFHHPDAMGSLDQSLPAALAWLNGHHPKPFFLLIHGGDAHYPYVCPPGFRDRFMSAGERGEAQSLVDSEFVTAYDPAGTSIKNLTLLKLRQVTAAKSDPRIMKRIIAQYDGCLSYGDSQLSKLDRAMTRFGLWKNTILIVLADHGEELGEHGGYGHWHRPLYEEIQHVPLVIDLPSGPAGRRVRSPIEQIDLLPTLLDLEGWAAPAGLEGRSFKSLLEPGPIPWEDKGLWAQAPDNEQGPKRLDLEAFRDGDWKVVRQGYRWELFNLARDPAESRDLLARDPGTFLRLAAEMMRLKLQP